MPKKIRPTRTDSAPTVLVTVGAVSCPVPYSDNTGHTPHVLQEVSVCVSRRRVSGWTDPAPQSFEHWRKAWDYIDSVGRSGRRVYVVAYRVVDVLTLLHYWDRVEKREIDTGVRKVGRPKKGEMPEQNPSGNRYPLVMGQKCEIVGYRLKGVSYRWVGATNWGDMSLSDMSRPKGGGEHIPFDALSSDNPTGYAADTQALIVMRYMQRLTEWWRAAGAGTWKDSIGSAAWSSYLRNTPEIPIVEHDDRRALDMESAAIFGGRASVWYYGNIGDVSRWVEYSHPPGPSNHGKGLPGPIHRYDVRGMYPSILRDETFPVRLIRVIPKCSIRILRTLLSSFECIADVQLSDPHPIYPQRTQTDTRYPVGTFRAILTTPEIRQAFEEGSLGWVGSVAVYTRGRPFRDWSEWVLRLRDWSPKQSDYPLSVVAKSLAVALGGRMGRRPCTWIDRPRVIPQQWWGEWPVTDSETGQHRYYRAICGRVQERIYGSDRKGTLAACFAFLTAYGRVRMNVARDVCGVRSVIWQDTDGMYVTNAGRKRLESSGLVGSGEYGKLQYEATVHHARFLTPKHYWTDGHWTLSGIADGFEPLDDMLVNSNISANPVRSGIAPTEHGIYHHSHVVDLSAIDPGIEIAKDGWAIPPLAAGEELRKIQAAQRRQAKGKR